MSKPKGHHTLTVVCERWTHEVGWELRLIIGGHGMHMTSVARSDGEMHVTVETWKTAMMEKGWN